MFTPCRITTRPRASVIQRPSWVSGGVGPAAAAGPAAIRASTAMASTLRTRRKYSLPDGRAPLAWRRRNGCPRGRRRRPPGLWPHMCGCNPGGAPAATGRPIQLVLHDLAARANAVVVAGLDHVVAAAASDLVAPVVADVDLVVATLAAHDVRTVPAGEVVVVGVTDHVVVAGLAVLDVVAGAAHDRVVAGAAVENVVALVTADVVLALVAVDLVVALVAVELVVGTGALDVVALVVALDVRALVVVVLALVVAVLALVVLIELARRRGIVAPTIGPGDRQPREEDADRDQHPQQDQVSLELHEFPSSPRRGICLIPLSTETRQLVRNHGSLASNSPIRRAPPPPRRPSSPRLWRSPGRGRR